MLPREKKHSVVGIVTSRHSESWNLPAIDAKILKVHHASQKDTKQGYLRTSTKQKYFQGTF